VIDCKECGILAAVERRGVAWAGFELEVEHWCLEEMGQGAVRLWKFVFLCRFLWRSFFLHLGLSDGQLQGNKRKP
jgi:hypothetical protein